MAAISNRRPQNQDPHHFNGNSLDSRALTLNADAIFYTTRLFSPFRQLFVKLKLYER